MAGQHEGQGCFMYFAKLASLLCVFALGIMQEGVAGLPPSPASFWTTALAMLKPGLPDLTCAFCLLCPASETQTSSAGLSNF